MSPVAEIGKGRTGRLLMTPPGGGREKNIVKQSRRLREGASTVATKGRSESSSEKGGRCRVKKKGVKRNTREESGGALRRGSNIEPRVPKRKRRAFRMRWKPMKRGAGWAGGDVLQ